jgi:hypothetical protein
MPIEMNGYLLLGTRIPLTFGNESDFIFLVSFGGVSKTV